MVHTSLGHSGFFELNHKYLVCSAFRFLEEAEMDIKTKYEILKSNKDAMVNIENYRKQMILFEPPAKYITRSKSNKNKL